MRCSVGTQDSEHPSDSQDAASGLWFSASPTPPKKPRQTKSHDRAGVWLCSRPTGDASASLYSVLPSSDPAWKWLGCSACILTLAPCSLICVWQNLGWTLMDDGSIRIEEATEEALGTYTCVPYNTLGTMGQSAPARLVLKVRLEDGACSPPWWAVFLWPTFHTCLCASIRTPRISRCYQAGSTGRRPAGSCSSPVQRQGTPSLSSPGGRYLGFGALALWGRQEGSSGGSLWTCGDRTDVWGVEWGGHMSGQWWRVGNGLRDC